MKIFNKLTLLATMLLGLQSTHYAMNQNEADWPRQSNDQYIYKIDREAFPANLYDNRAINLGPEISVIKNNFNSGMTRISITREIGQNGYIYRIMETWTTKSPSYLTWKNGALVLGTAALVGSSLLAFKNQEAINDWWNTSSTNSTDTPENNDQSYFDAIKGWMPSLPSWNKNKPNVSESHSVAASTNKNEPGYLDRIKEWMPSFPSWNKNKIDWNDEFKEQQYYTPDQDLINNGLNTSDIDNFHDKDYGSVYENQALPDEDSFDWISDVFQTQNPNTFNSISSKNKDIDYSEIYDNQPLLETPKPESVSQKEVATPVVKIVQAKGSQNIVTTDANLVVENAYQKGEEIQTIPKTVTPMQALENLRKSLNLEKIKDDIKNAFTGPEKNKVSSFQQTPGSIGDYKMINLSDQSMKPANLPVKKTDNKLTK